MKERFAVVKAIGTSLLWLFLMTLSGLVLIVIVVVWDALHFPTSFNEVLFRYRLTSAAESGVGEIRMADLARFDWEEVCVLGAYGGDFQYDKYHRVYRNQGHSEGDVTIIFIERDGSPTYFMVGTNGVYIGSQGCWPRDEARMRRVRDASSQFSMVNDIPH